MTIHLDFNILLPLFDLGHVIHLFETFQHEIKEVSDICEDISILKLVKLRGAILDMFIQSLHHAFLQGYSMALTQEVISHQAFQSIDKGHILSESSDEVRQLYLIIIRKMG